MKPISILLLSCGALAAVGAAVAPFCPVAWSNAIHGLDAGALALVTYLGLKSPQAIGSGK